MDWRAKWIWSEGEKSPRNYYWCARKVFDVDTGHRSVSLKITADSRYSLWVNGQYVGHGSVRAFTDRWRYDTYDISAYVTAGENVVGVLVHHFGHSNFQYLEARGGLLVQVECDENVVTATDSTWRGISHPSYCRRTPRISCQQGWVEHFDARVEPVGWTLPGFDASGWDSASVIGDAGCEPWIELLPRDIPFLNQEPVYPAGLVRMQPVRSPGQVWSMDLKHAFVPGDRESSKCEFVGVIATVVQCSERMRIRVRAMDNRYRDSRLNGATVEWDVFELGIVLDAGDHLFVLDVGGVEYHERFGTFIFDNDAGSLVLCSPLGEECEFPFITVGPFDGGEPQSVNAVLEARTPAEVAAHPYAKAIHPDYTAEAHVAALTSSAIACDGEVQVEHAEGFFSAGEDCSIIYPPSSGDVELLLDFGKEIVGFIEMDLLAPECTIIDFHGFEHMASGRIQWPGKYAELNNVFRYVSGSGWKKWRSTVRRGFRYATLTVRFPPGCSEPVKVRSICCHMNTYPFEETGQFTCSDGLLNRVWDVSRWTLRLCSEDTFVDCPAYEQVFWVGDAVGESLFSYYAFGDYRLARRCLLLAAESLSRSPMVESQVPSGWRKIIPAWSLLWSIGCYEHFLYSGDESFLREVYPALRLQNRNIRDKFISSQSLFEIEAWNFLDWAAMDTPNKGVVAHQNMMLVEALRRSEKIAVFLGYSEDASEYLTWAHELTDAINRHLWDDKNQAYCDCIHEDGTLSSVFSEQTQTLAYLYEIVPEDKREAFARRLIDLPTNWVKIGTPFIAMFAVQALAKAGMTWNVVELLRKRWGLMLDRGATACWEMFPGDHSVGGWPTRSHCQGWSAVPVYALPAFVLGVRPVEPGFRLFDLNPDLAGLHFARGVVPTPHGPIEVDASLMQEDGIALSFTVPYGTVARVKGNEYHSGRHSIVCSAG